MPYGGAMMGIVGDLLGKVDVTGHKWNRDM